MCSLLNDNIKKIIIYPFPVSGNHPLTSENPFPHRESAFRTRKAVSHIGKALSESGKGFPTSGNDFRNLGNGFPNWESTIGHSGAVSRTGKAVNQQ